MPKFKPGAKFPQGTVDFVDNVQALLDQNQKVLQGAHGVGDESMAVQLMDVKLAQAKGELKGALDKIGGETPQSIQEQCLSCHGVNPVLYHKAMEKFTKDCRKIVHDSQQDIMQKPGLWTKFKATMEKILPFKADKETLIAKNVEYKKAFNAVKDHKPKEEQEPDLSTQQGPPM